MQIPKELKKIAGIIRYDMIETHQGDINSIAKDCAESLLFESERLMLRSYLDSVNVLKTEKEQLFEQWKLCHSELIFENSMTLFYFLNSLAKELNTPAIMQGDPPSWYNR